MFFQLLPHDEYPEQFLKHKLPINLPGLGVVLSTLLATLFFATPPLASPFSKHNPLTDTLLEAGGDDYEDGGETWGILTEPESLHQVREAIEALGLEVNSGKWIMVPQNGFQVEGETLVKLMRLMEKLDNHDDVQNIWNNADFDESELQ